MEVEIRFKATKENDKELFGLVSEGSYLIDAARRLGVRLEAVCEQLPDSQEFVFKIEKGAELLSQPTKLELELLNESRRNNGERLASQAKIVKSGEIVIMPIPKKEEPKVEDKIADFQTEFAKLPLQEKISTLLQLESITLADTVSAVLNSPYMLGDKIVEIMAHFGLKMDEADRKAKQPAEHHEEPSVEPKVDEPKAAVSEEPKKTTSKSPAAKPTAAKKPAAKRPAKKPSEPEK